MTAKEFVKNKRLGALMRAARSAMLNADMPTVGGDGSWWASLFVHDCFILYTSELDLRIAREGVVEVWGSSGPKLAGAGFDAWAESVFGMLEEVIRRAEDALEQATGCRG